MVLRRKILLIKLQLDKFILLVFIIFRKKNIYILYISKNSIIENIILSKIILNYFKLPKHKKTSSIFKKLITKL